MTIEKQKQIADYLLSMLDIIDPSCILAGGAPRDWFFNQEATDLDIYLCLGDISLQDMHKQLYNIGLIDSSQSCNADFLDNDDYIKSDRFKWILTFYYEGQKVQIMVMYKPVVESVLSHFSLSICKIWYKAGVVHITSEFLKTVEEKIIRQTETAFGMDYVNKISQKFPDYTFIDMQEF